jgi:hypothetical protein
LAFVGVGLKMTEDVKTKVVKDIRKIANYGENTIPHSFKIPITLSQLIKVSAENNKRSINAEVVHRLTTTFD